MKRLITLLATTALALGATVSTSATAQAASCRSGYFCVWTHAGFDGMKIEHGGDGRWWEGDMVDQDSSWANHGVSGPGVKDHVRSTTAAS
ncbi:peptidase inhibitor family I36 protein [Streptomyces sp. WAC05374]|uniref:peptidase inhibitor family I36 protein n=1 Tax=Streptomyces sp. WAC05374 TaxID=2487420 RepID=UPI0026B73267|nr:peptidase inhibitor family I36 protein [Streptomyces sp. WAC05374]